MSLASTLTRATLESGSTTRLLVLPLLEMPLSLYQHYLHTLRRIGSVIPLNALTYHPPTKDTPFKGTNWRKGKVRIEFVDGSVPVVQQQQTVQSNNVYDDPPKPIPLVTSPSPLTLNYDWDELQVSGKIMGVLCITSSSTLSSSTPSSLAQQSFTDVRAQLLHPGGPFLYRCFVFDSQLTPQEVEKIHVEKKELWCWIPQEKVEEKKQEEEEDEDAVFSPSTSSPVSSSPSRTPVDFFILTCLHSLAAALLDNYEASIKKLPQAADLKSPLEAASILATNGTNGTLAANNTAEQQARAKKVRPGRQKKFIADYCLLAGDSYTAIKHYKAAADAAKAATDSIWHASALLGHAAALMAMDEEKENNNNNGMAASTAATSPSSSSSSNASQDAIIELCEESLSILSRVLYASILRIDASFKLARYFQRCGKPCESADVLVRMYESKMDCSAHDQIALASEAAILCHQLGFKRKFAFFLVQAAGLYKELHQSASCHALLRCASEVFGVEGVSADDGPKRGNYRNDDNDNGFMQHQSSTSRSDMSHGRWVFLQRSVLEHLISSARLMQDDALTARCILHLLRTLHPWLDVSYQNSISQELWEETRLMPVDSTGETIDCCGIPVIHSVRVVELQEERKVWRDTLVGEEEAEEEEEDADGTDEESSSLGVGTRARVLRAEAALSSDVFLARPTDARGGGNSTRKRTYSSAALTSDNHPSSSGSFRHTQSTTYASSEPIDFEVVLTNPLKIPLLIQQMCLVTHCTGGTDTSRCDSYPLSLTLTPLQTQRVILTCLPRFTSGELKIKAIEIRVWNITYRHKIDRHGKGVRPSYDTADVSLYCKEPTLATSSSTSTIPLTLLALHPPLPYMTFSYTLCGNMSSSLLLGEIREGYITLHNSGTLPIGDVELFAQPLWRKGSRRAQDVYYEVKEEQEEMKRNLEVRGLASSASSTSITTSSPTRPLLNFSPSQLLSQLPLLPGRSLTLPLSITAHTDCRGVSFVVSYAALPAASAVSSPSSTTTTKHRAAAESFRCIRREEAWQTEKGLSVRQMQIYQFVGASSSSTTSSASSASLAVSGSPTPSSSSAFLSAVSNVSASIPSILLSPIPPSSSGASIPMFSPSSSSSTVSSSHLLPSLSHLSSTDCMLILELLNTSTASFRLTCHIDGVIYKTSGIRVERLTEKRVIIPIPRMNLGSTEEEQYLRQLAMGMADGGESGGSSSATAAGASNTWQNDPIYRTLLSRFRSRVRISWTSSDESSGLLVGMSDEAEKEACVDLSPVHLYRLLPDPIEFQSSLTKIDQQDGSDSTPNINANSTPSLYDIGSPIFSSPKWTPRVSSAASEKSYSSMPLMSLPSSLPSSLSSGTRALVGSFHRLSVTLINHSGLDLSSLELSILPYQESVNGMMDTSLSQKMLVTGSLTRRFAQCHPQQILEHHVLICFLSIGRFNFQMSVRQIRNGKGSEDSNSLAGSPTAAKSALSVSSSSSSDPFSLLSSIAASTIPSIGSSALLRSTVRRRAVAALSTDLSSLASAQQATLLFSDETDHVPYELDIEMDEEEEEEEQAHAHDAKANNEATAERIAPTGLVHQCPNVLIIQATTT